PTPTTHTLSLHDALPISDAIYEDKSRNVLAPQWSPSGDKIIFGIGAYNAFFNGFHGLFLKPEDRAEGGAQIAVVNPDGSGFHERSEEHTSELQSRSDLVC